jgi:hypothetical protein
MSGIAADGRALGLHQLLVTSGCPLQVSRPLIGFPGPDLEVIKQSNPLKGF